MGLTAGCAVCHDHKFDPLPSKDYYSLYAFFHSAADPPLDGNALLTAPTIKLAKPADQRRLADFDAQIAAKKKLREKQLAAKDTKPHLEALARELSALEKQRTELDKNIPGTFIFRDLDKPRDSFVMIRGQYNKPVRRSNPVCPLFFRI